MFRDPDVVRALNLSDAQLRGLQTVMDRVEQRREYIAQHARRDPATAQRLIDDLQSAGMERAQQILTEPQRRAFARMTGEGGAAAPRRP